MRINKINSNTIIAALLFLGLLTIYPQGSYAKTAVNAYDSMNVVNATTELKLKMIAMGVSKLASGHYQINLLLQNTSPYTGYLTLTPNYIIKLIDANGQAHKMKIDKKQINYPDECRQGIVSGAECLITITGKIKEQLSDKEIKYKACSVTLTYSNDATNETISQTFQEETQDIVVAPSLKMLSPASGVYTLKIQNIAADKVRIKEIVLQSKCINLNEIITNINIASNHDHEIKFQLNMDPLHHEECNESIAITYQLGNDESKLKTVLIPLKISQTQETPWYSWDNYGWVLSTTPSVIIAAAIIYKTYDTIRKIHHEDGLADIIDHLSNLQLD